MLALLVGLVLMLLHLRKSLTIDSTPLWVLAPLILAGFGFRAASILRVDWQMLCPDFPVFYAGGKLAGTPDLYSAERARAIQRELVPCVPENAVFIRWPFFAGVMSGLARLPYSEARLGWGILSVAALAAFVWLWPAPRPLTLLACAWSVPLVWNLAMGQDVTFLMLWLAAGVALAARGRQFLAGLVLSLCVAKFQLFLLAPLLLLRWRMWRTMLGVLAGLAGLVALSFLISGWNWPLQYWRAISSPVMDPNPSMMPNIAGLASLAAHGRLLEIACATLAAATVVWIVYHATPEIGLAAVIIGGLLVSHHAYPADALIVLPACLLAAVNGRHQTTLVAAFIPLAPVVYQLPVWLAWPSAGVVFCAALIALVREGKSESVEAFSSDFRTATVFRTQKKWKKWGQTPFRG